jgi:hypothetical protein
MTSTIRSPSQTPELQEHGLSIHATESRHLVSTVLWALLSLCFLVQPLPEPHQGEC